MLWSLAFGSAFGTPGTSGASSDCAPGGIGAIAPADGATVLPTVVLVLEPEGNCGLGGVSLEPVGGDEPAAVDITNLDGLMVMTPQVPLAEGEWEVSIYDYYVGGNAVFSSFTVDVDAPPAAPVAEPLTTSVTAERNCGRVLTTDVIVTSTFPVPSGVGLVRYSILTEAGEAGSAHRLPGASASLALQVLGGTEVCTVLQGTDLAGAVLWESERVCAEAFEGCPSEDAVEEDPEGCGCAAVNEGSTNLFPLAALGSLLLRRRRRTR